MNPTHAFSPDQEAALIAKAANGDLQAFNELILVFQDMVYQHACVLLGNHAEAEDVTQESFIKAYRAIKQFRRGSFRAWILKIATNTAYDLMRQTRRYSTQSLSVENQDGEELDLAEKLADPAPSLLEMVEQRELSKDIYSILMELSGEHRSVLTLIDMYDYDYREAADILQVPVGTIKSRLARARVIMKEKLRLLEEYPLYSSSPSPVLA